jgi:hypothetical protein
VARELVFHVAGVERGGWLEEQNPAFFVGDGLVLDSAGHDDELARFEFDAFVSEFDAEAALYHQEHLVFVLVVMPDELAFQLVELHQLSVQFAGDVGLPVFVDLGEFGSEVDLVHNADEMTGCDRRSQIN